MPEHARINVETYRRFERNEGKQYSRATVAAISEALDWPTDALWEIANGADAPDRREEVQALREDLNAAYERLSELDDLFRELVDEVNRLRRSRPE